MANKEVRSIIEKLRSEGKSYGHIARHLNKSGFRSTTGKLWTAGLVFHLLERFKDLDFIHSAVEEIKKSNMSERVKSFAIDKLLKRNAS